MGGFGFLNKEFTLNAYFVDSTVKYMEDIPFQDIVYGYDKLLFP